MDKQLASAICLPHKDGGSSLLPEQCSILRVLKGVNAIYKKILCKKVHVAGPINSLMSPSCKKCIDYFNILIW